MKKDVKLTHLPKDTEAFAYSEDHDKQRRETRMKKWLPKNEHKTEY